MNDKNNVIIFLIFLSILIIIYYIYRSSGVSSSEKQKCPDGIVGDFCQYTDLDFCNGRGKVSLNENGEPICKCNGNFDGENCEKCKDGYKGNMCNFSKKITCNDRGELDIDIYDNPICTCIHPFDGKNCEKCKDGYAGSVCQYTSEEMCSNRGTVKVDKNDNPKCECEDGWYGNFCENSGEIRCNRNGRFDFEVKNKCICKTGYSGTKCQYDSSSCLNGGVLYDYDERRNPPKLICDCRTGYGGDRCEFQQSYECGDRGFLINVGGAEPVCQCYANTNYINKTRKNCTECKDGFYGNRCNYSNLDCNGYPLINFDTNKQTFECDCPKEEPLSEIRGKGKISGKRCQFPDRKTCNNRGYISYINETVSPAIVKCTCDGGEYSNFRGDKCELCKDGFKGSKCQYSNITTCNNRGTVNDNGICSCDTSKGYTGPNCNSCLDNYYEIRNGNKLICATKQACNNNGKPTKLLDDGKIKCICDNGYIGDNCETKFLL